MARSYYVVYREDAGWSIKLERGQYIQTGFGTQKKAIDEARRLAQQPGTAAETVVVNRKDGATRRHISNP